MRRLIRPYRIYLCIILLLALALPARASEPFAVAAKGAALIDGDTGRVLFGQNENRRLPMASTTKVMTALLALENAGLDEPVTASKNASGVPGTSLYLSVGETLSMEHMLYGLMLRSGNDAAVAIAEHVAGSVPAFAEMMNARAAELGVDAHYVNPHGLDAEGHAISALGLCLVMRQAMQDPDFRRITGTRRKVIPWVGNEFSRVLENKNRLLRTYEGATGGKTGYTGRAGRCLVFSAERDGLSLIGAVLNCPTWFDTATALLDYGFENFRMEAACEAGARLAELPVVGGEALSVDIGADGALKAAVPVGSVARTEIDLPNELEAPVLQGEQVGSASLVCGGQVLARCGLVADETVERRSFARSLTRLLRRWALLFAP